MTVETKLNEGQSQRDAGRRGPRIDIVQGTETGKNNDKECGLLEEHGPLTLDWDYRIGPPSHELQFISTLSSIQLLG